jgi:hypothetical protein
MEVMADLLLHFDDLFPMPASLLPHHVHNHQIQILPGTAPVAVQPYRYTYAQKAELEHQCGKMLQQGTIQTSSSAFSTPVLLVKKADSFWRLYINYRALNTKTIRDKFPIPVIEELLDELGGVTYFSKLDLRSGYHQSACTRQTWKRWHSGHMRASLSSSSCRSG